MPSLNHQANETVDALHALALAVDRDYAEACLDTSCTNQAPANERELFVSLLEGVALVINGSGLCDNRDTRFAGFRDYLADHGWRAPEVPR